MYIARQKLSTAITIISFLVWMINGFFCKVLNLVPRHQQIVAEILGNEYAANLTRIIGGLEIGMALWILSRFWQRLSIILQIVAVASMNIIEFILVPDLLLFGRLNLVVALGFIGILIIQEWSRRELRPSINFNK